MSVKHLCVEFVSKNNNLNTVYILSKYLHCKVSSMTLFILYFNL